MATERIIGIVTGIIRHSDRYNVVNLYTREKGHISVLSPAGTGRNARLRNARLQPLAIITADISFKANRDLQTLGAFIPFTTWRDIYFNPPKSAIAFFLAEFLNAFLRQSLPDPALWDYIATSLQSLDNTRRSVANRHIAFLVGLLPHAGIAPDISMPENAINPHFDMREGIITDEYPLHKDILTPEETLILPTLSRITAANCHCFRFSATQRRRCLYGLMHFYAVHYPGLSSLKSPEILALTFS